MDCPNATLISSTGDVVWARLDEDDSLVGVSHNDFAQQGVPLSCGLRVRVGGGRSGQTPSLDMALPEEDLPFLRALDGDPADRATRLVYADFLDERGRGPEAALQRWLAANHKHPVLMPVDRDDREQLPSLVHGFWGWRGHLHNHPAGPQDLPDDVSDALGRRHWPYHCRHWAELALLPVLTRTEKHL